MADEKTSFERHMAAVVYCAQQRSDVVKDMADALEAFADAAENGEFTFGPEETEIYRSSSNQILAKSQAEISLNDSRAMIAILKLTLAHQKAIAERGDLS